MLLTLFLGGINLSGSVVIRIDLCHHVWVTVQGLPTAHPTVPEAKLFPASSGACQNSLLCMLLVWLVGSRFGVVWSLPLLVLKNTHIFNFVQGQAEIGCSAAYMLKKILILYSFFYLFLNIFALILFVHFAICPSVLPSIQKMWINTCSMPLLW